MTDTPTPPAMTPEQRAELVNHTFYAGAVYAAEQLEADGVTIATLTAERDAAEFRETMAANKAVEYLERAEAAEAALATVFEIASTRHIPDQPAAYAGTELEWATRQYGSLRRDILDAIQKGAAT